MLYSFHGYQCIRHTHSSLYGSEIKGRCVLTSTSRSTPALSSTGNAVIAKAAASPINPTMLWGIITRMSSFEVGRCQCESRDVCPGRRLVGVV